MKSTKRILALLMAAVLMLTMSACEIAREGREEAGDNSANDVNIENEPGVEDISSLIYGNGSDYQVWYADNGNIYAFNSAKQFYLKQGDAIYYGVYEFNASRTAEYYAELLLMSDDDSDMHDTFNVTKENEDFVLIKADNAAEIVRITKEKSVVSEAESTDSASGDMEIYEILGLNIYYLTMSEALLDGDTPTIVVNAAPALSVKAEDGTVKYEYDSENLIQITLNEDTKMYMPGIEAPSSETYGCDIYQMKECFDAFNSFYAMVIGEGDNVESVQYYHVAE